MEKKIIVAVVLGLVVAVSGKLFAGGMENLAAGAEKTFFKSVSAGNVQAVVSAAAPEVTAVSAAASEYQKLAAAFEKGTGPTKEELTGWHAGRFFDKDLPDDPGSMLLAGGEMQAEPVNGVPAEKAYKLVPVTTYGSPTFYETMDADLAAGVAVFIKSQQAKWTKPQFGPAGVTFEMIMPSYDKGFSRWEARKTEDGRILLKHIWKSDMGPPPASEGSAYAFFTKDVTPPAQHFPIQR